MIGWVRVSVACPTCAWKAVLPTLEYPQTFADRLYHRHVLQAHPDLVPIVVVVPTPPTQAGA